MNLSAPLVKTVYVVFKCHLDLGFTDTQAGVLRCYFDEYFPQAMETAVALRVSGGGERYVWTVGSWLLSQYWEQATPVQQKRIAQAIKDGDLAWNALPFSWQSELLDASLLEAALGLSGALDTRFSVKTTGAKMTDVPGHTRGMVGPLARAGITFLDIGVNPASRPPDVPPLFRWREPEGAEIIVLYHHDYGGTQCIPGSDSAVSVYVKHDNSGVHSRDEITEIYTDLQRQFPGAQIVASSLSAVAAVLEPYRASLPVVTQEIGDSWIYGAASDPVKMAQYRELSRLRREWIAKGQLKADSAEDRAWISRLLLAPEHTWGCDIKETLGDWTIYTPAELTAARGRPNFRKVESTWAEKRANIEAAVAALPPNLEKQAHQRLASLVPVPPRISGLVRLAPGEEVATTHFTLVFDPETGAMTRLQNKKTGREWATGAHPLGLFSYQTFSAAGYKRFLYQYLMIDASWPPQDFGKPGLENYPAESRVWHPARAEVWGGRDGNVYRVVTELQMPDAGKSAALVAWPERLTMEWSFPDDDPAAHLQFQWFGKAANRLPEAMWLSFAPVAPDRAGWRLDKLDQPIAPQDVVSHGGRNLHAVTRGAEYKDEQERFVLETLDAPLIAPGRLALLDFDNRIPDMAGGMHVNLFNNAWGTNYRMWLDDDLRFRFTLRV